MADPSAYLHARMSLISKENIRYEGMCQDIDMPNSTIVLGHVRCFGSEGRRGVNEVPASDQIFEKVVFKGTEIQELTVMQPEAPPPPAPITDPAILSSVTAPPAPPSNPWGTAPAAAAAPAFGSNPWSTGPAPPPPQQQHPAAKQAPAVAPTVAVAARPQQQQQQQQQANGGAAQQRPAPRERPSSYAHAAGGASHPPRGGGRGGRGQATGGGRGGQQASGGRGQYHTQHHAAAAGGGGRGHGPSAPRVVTVGPPPVAIPTEEFNFEEALKKFNKDDLVKEATAEANKTTYQKDDFFDNLSCEALEKQELPKDSEGNPDRRGRLAAMRKHDIETFGTSRRGGGAGGRGGFRGRGRGGRSGGRGEGGRGEGGRGRGGGNTQQKTVAASS